MPKRASAADTLTDDDERLWLTGKGGASFFCPLKWRRSGTTPALPKVCRTGRSDMQPTVCGITPASHVTQNAKNMANAGRTLGTGLVAGACHIQAGV